MTSYAAALARKNTAAGTAVDGVHYLLGAGEWGEFVARYETSELIQVFSAVDRDALAAGKRIWHGRGSWIDMVAATRAAAA